jgi:hypothetical protein
MAALWDLDTGHDMMITEPGSVADRLTQLASVDPAPQPPGTFVDNRHVDRL